MLEAVLLIDFALLGQAKSSAHPEFIQKLLRYAVFIKWLWVSVPPIAVPTITFIVFGNSLASFLSLFGIEAPFRRSRPSENELQSIRRQLLVILDRDVKTRLANSLHELIKLDLYMEDQQQKVGIPKFESVPKDLPDFRDSSVPMSANQVLHPKVTEKPSLTLKFTQKIIEFFDRPDIKGKLLILGEPGSGKTTELLDLAQNLITRASEDHHHPIPLLLELSAWDGETIEYWIVSQLKKRLNIREPITQQWLEGNQLILLLDGLDELGLTKQNQCIEAINKFLEKIHPLGLVVCCRKEEYETGQVKLYELNGVIYLESLRKEQIQKYFEKLNRLRLWEDMRNSPVPVALAQKPLFLSMLVLKF